MKDCIGNAGLREWETHVCSHSLHYKSSTSWFCICNEKHRHNQECMTQWRNGRSETVNTVNLFNYGFDSYVTCLKRYLPSLLNCQSVTVSTSCCIYRTLTLRCATKWREENRLFSFVGLHVWRNSPDSHIRTTTSHHCFHLLVPTMDPEAPCVHFAGGLMQPWTYLKQCLAPSQHTDNWQVCWLNTFDTWKNLSMATKSTWLVSQCGRASSRKLPPTIIASWLVGWHHKISFRSHDLRVRHKMRLSLARDVHDRIHKFPQWIVRIPAAPVSPHAKLETNLQPKLMTHNSSLTNLWNAIPWFLWSCSVGQTVCHCVPVVSSTKN